MIFYEKSLFLEKSKYFYDFVYNKMIVVLTLRHDFATIAHLSRIKINLIEMSIVYQPFYVNECNELLSQN